MPGRTLPAAAVSGSDTKDDALYYGYGVAIGVDIALLQNVFVRGEYEFTTLHAYDIKFNLSTVRAGLGFKFCHDRAHAGRRPDMTSARRQLRTCRTLANRFKGHRIRF